MQCIRMELCPLSASFYLACPGRVEHILGHEVSIVVMMTLSSHAPRRIESSSVTLCVFICSRIKKGESRETNVTSKL